MCEDGLGFGPGADRDELLAFCLSTSREVLAAMWAPLVFLLFSLSLLPNVSQHLE